MIEILAVVKWAVVSSTSESRLSEWPLYPPIKGSVLSIYCPHYTDGINPRPTQPSIPLGSVNEYQLRLGRQRLVWFITLADKREVCR